MVSKKNDKEVYKDIYDAYDKDKLLSDGKEYLESNLKFKSKRHSRIFWIWFWVVLALGIWIGILSIVYLLERSNSMANSFEKSREKEFKKYEDDGDK